MNRPSSGRGTGGTEGGEQRQQVLVAGLGLVGIGVLLPDVQQGLHLPSAQLLGHPA
jgi:hypothetical protein